MILLWWSFHYHSPPLLSLPNFMVKTIKFLLHREICNWGVPLFLSLHIKMAPLHYVYVDVCVSHRTGTTAGTHCTSISHFNAPISLPLNCTHCKFYTCSFVCSFPSFVCSFVHLFVCLFLLCCLLLFIPFLKTHLDYTFPIFVCKHYDGCKMEDSVEDSPFFHCAAVVASFILIKFIFPFFCHKNHSQIYTYSK